MSRKFSLRDLRVTLIKASVLRQANGKLVFYVKFRCRRLRSVGMCGNEGLVQALSDNHIVLWQEECIEVGV